MNGSAPRLRVHDLLPCSRANGPGRRVVLWVQGCSLRCPGCANPATHAFEGGGEVLVPDLWRHLRGLARGQDGLTISGGEPLDQAPAMRALLDLVRRQGDLSVVLFTGYTWEEVQRRPDAADLLAGVDLLVAGRYDRDRRTACDLRGSSNQTVHFLTALYGPQDLSAIPPAEVTITATGQIVSTGLDALSLCMGASGCSQAWRPRDGAGGESERLNNRGALTVRTGWFRAEDCGPRR